MTARTRRWAGAWSAIFACSWGGNQFSPLLVMYEQRAHYSALMVNALLGVYVLGLAPALLIAGPLSDRRGRRPVMLAGIAAAVAGSALLALGPDGALFLAAGRLLSGCTVGIALAAGSTWIKELSQPPFDAAADGTSGARRSSLAFSAGACVGALVAGLIAQWGPAPEVLPFAIHIAVTVPCVLAVLATPETNPAGAAASGERPAGPAWRQLRVRSAGHRRFVRVVAVAAPWVFGGAALGYGYLPTQLRGVTGSWGLVFATATTVVALGVSSVIQPAAKRLHSGASARGLAAGLLVLAAGIAACVLAIAAQSVWWGLAANVVIGAGLGITMVSGLLEVQAIAAPGDLAGLTGAFYALAYAGFLAPVVISAIAGAIPVTAILWVIVALAVACWALVLSASTRHLPVTESPLSRLSRRHATVHLGAVPFVPDALLPGRREMAWRTSRVPPRGRCWRWRPSRTTLASPPSASVTGSGSPNGPPAGMSRSCGRPSCRSSRSAARSAATGWVAACGCRR